MRRVRAAAGLLLFTAGITGAQMTDLSARQRPEGREPAPGRAEPLEQAPASIERSRIDPTDANATRTALMKVLARHPPSVGRVLKVDPSLMTNEPYLANYPSLRQFLDENPEVRRNADYYLDHIHGLDEYVRPTPEQELVAGTLIGLAAFTAFGVVTAVLIWVIRTSLEQRRWNRLSKIQADVHSKLMDRFTSNEELLTYAQTPSGRRFLESGPSPLQEMAPSIAAPFSRILWSVQVGSVLLVAGLGLLFLSGRAIPEVREFFYISGCLATALGAGFVVSAAAAYVLSRRLGLLDPPASSNA